MVQQMQQHYVVLLAVLALVHKDVHTHVYACV